MLVAGVFQSSGPGFGSPVLIKLLDIVNQLVRELVSGIRVSAVLFVLTARGHPRMRAVVAGQLLHVESGHFLDHGHGPDMLVENMTDQTHHRPGSVNQLLVVE